MIRVGVLPLDGVLEVLVLEGTSRVAYLVPHNEAYKWDEVHILTLLPHLLTEMVYEARIFDFRGHFCVRNVLRTTDNTDCYDQRDGLSVLTVATLRSNW